MRELTATMEEVYVNFLFKMRLLIGSIRKAVRGSQSISKTLAEGGALESSGQNKSRYVRCFQRAQ